MFSSNKSPWHSPTRPAPAILSTLREILPYFIILPLVWWILSQPETKSFFPPPRDTTKFNFQPKPDQLVPNYLHYVGNLDSDAEKARFGLIEYLCLTSSLRVLKPEVIFFHTTKEPTSFFYKEWKSSVIHSNETKLEIVLERDVTQIKGNLITNFAHKADVIRLEALQAYGGIYLDMDVMVLQDFRPLLKYEMVMGEESSVETYDGVEGSPGGLCNAVIIAKPFAPFLSRWIESYSSFNRYNWNTHSVLKPLELAKQHPTEITVKNKFSFFFPLWSPSHIALIHTPSLHPYDFYLPSTSQKPFDQSSKLLISNKINVSEEGAPVAPAYTYHLWNSLAWEKYLRFYTLDDFFSESKEKIPFVELGKRFVDEGLRERWRKNNGVSIN